MKNKIKRFLSFKTVASKLILACLIACLAVFIAMFAIFDEGLFDLETTLVENKLASDLNYLDDDLCDRSADPWSIENGTLFCNGIALGDGTQEHANLEPFKKFEQKSGSLCYSFIKTGDEGLGWVGSEENGYQQGHYLRISGTTTGAHGKSLVGSYIDKRVADIIDTAGFYDGESNVDGVRVYCFYKAVRDNSGEIVGCISVGQSIQQMYLQTSRAKSRIIGTMIIVLLISGLIFTLISARWSRSISRINEYIARLGRGEFPDEKLKLKTQDELSEVADCVNELSSSLKEHVRLGAELSVAKNIQLSLLPHNYPAFPGHDEFDILAQSQPARQVGGDFYDYFMIDDHRVGFIIADVSGKGVPAALFMATAKMLIRDHALLCMSPKDVFTSVNSILCDGNKVGLFVTAWMGYLDFEASTLTYANAGHNPPLVKRRNGEFEFLRSKPSLVLAGMEGLRYREYTIPFEPGDRLFLYTDGVTEATDKSNRLYGDERLRSCLNNLKDRNVADLLSGVQSNIDDFVGTAEQFDDVTMMIFDYLKGKESSDTEFPAQAEELDAVTDFVTGRLEELGASVKTVTQISVALEEIFINIASYAYPDNGGIVRISVFERDGYAVVTFRDSGIPFNPLDKPDPDVTLGADERSIGGLGIFMVKKTMDRVEYEYKDNQNVLILEKKLK